MKPLTLANLDDAITRLEASLAEPPLTLAASGGGIRTETGNNSSEIVLDGAVLVPRMLVEGLVSVLKQINLTPAPAVVPAG